MQYLIEMDQTVQLVPQGDSQAERQAGERVINFLQPDRKYIAKDRKII